MAIVERYHSITGYKYLLLAFLLVSMLTGKAAAQISGIESHPLKAAGSLKDDTLLINQYIENSRKLKSIPPDSTLQMLHMAYRLARRNGLQHKTGTIWGLMAATYVRKGNYAACGRYLDSAFRLSARLNDGELTCFLHSVAAAMYQYSSRYAQAASHYFKALETVQAYNLQQSPVLPSLYNNLGALMILLHERVFSRNYLLQAKQYALQGKPVDSVNLSYILVNLGQTYIDSAADVSVGYFKDAYKLAKKRNDIFFSHRILINLARTYMDQKQYDSAGYYLDLSRQVAVTEPSMAETETYTGYLMLYRKDYPSAARHLETALHMAEDSDYESLEEIYQGLADLYIAQKQYRKASEYQKKHADLYEQKMDDEKKIVVDFMLHFQAMQQEKSLTQKQAEIAAKERGIRKRNAWIAAMCLSSLLLCIILVMAVRNYRNRRMVLNGRIQAMQQQQEIDRLKAEADGADKERARIAYDLHDGIMARLSNVKMNLNFLPSLFPGFAENSRYKDIIRQFEIATGELRNTAHNLMPEILLEDGIAQAVFYFCKSMESASGVTIKYQQIGQPLPRLQPFVETTVYRIVQELVQNITRHAQASAAVVQLLYSDNFCSVTVEDNGAGLPERDGYEGYGLKSVRKRIAVLNGSFDMESEPGKGTTAFIEFDVRPFTL